MPRRLVHFRSYADIKADIRRERILRFLILWVVGVAVGATAGCLLAVLGHVVDPFVNLAHVEDEAMLRLLLGGWLGALFGGMLGTQAGLA